MITFLEDSDIDVGPKLIFDVSTSDFMINQIEVYFQYN